MNDLIRRQEAIDAIGNLSDEMYRTVEKGATFPTKAWFDGMAQAEHIVKNLPSAQPEQKWIPCSERLPNGQTEVIVSCCDDSGDSKYNYTSFGWMTRDGEYWIVDNEINYYVNAWIPLPAPWKGEQE